MISHKDLDVWKRAIGLAGLVYRVTEEYPKTEIYGIINQMRRAAISISANIAEGAARQSKKEFIQFLYIALGSASELDTLIEISYVTNRGKKDNLMNLQNDLGIISRMIQGLIRSLKKN